MGAAGPKKARSSYRHTVRIAGPCWATELSARGWDPTLIPEGANHSKPDLVRESAECAFDAGARILIANTAQANTLTLSDATRRSAIAKTDPIALIHRAVEICRAATRPDPQEPAVTYGAMGPVESLMLLNEIGEAALDEAYSAQAEWLHRAGVDGIVCRRFTELPALLCAVRAAKAHALTVTACMVFDSGPEFGETAMGVTIPQACEALKAAGADAIGCDDYENQDSLVGAITAIRSLVELPIWAGMRAGRGQLQDGRLVYSEKPGELAQRLKSIIEAGASVVMAGAGVTTDHIAALAAARSALR